MKVIIFSRGRCGTSSLFGALRQHPNLRGISEPFNPHRKEPKFSASSTAELELAMQQIWSQCSLIKHNWTEGDWPFNSPNARRLNEYLLAGTDTHYIFLHRRNVLARFVSEHIARQSGVWNIALPEARERIRTAAYERIDEHHLQQTLATELDTIRHYHSIVAEHGAPLHELWYEDIFAEGVSAEQRLQRFNEILMFLGLEIKEMDLTRVSHFLVSPERKINSETTLRLVPGIDAVNQQYGADETGWLFPP